MAGARKFPELGLTQSICTPALSQDISSRCQLEGTPRPRRCSFNYGDARDGTIAELERKWNARVEEAKASSLSGQGQDLDTQTPSSSALSVTVSVPGCTSDTDSDCLLNTETKATAKRLSTLTSLIEVETEGPKEPAKRDMGPKASTTSSLLVPEDRRRANSAPEAHNHSNSATVGIQDIGVDGDLRLRDVGDRFQPSISSCPLRRTNSVHC